MSAIRVLIVDDHQVVREGLQQMLKPEADIKVVGEADSFEVALKQAESLSPDIILMDIKMPGVDGVEATRRIKAKMPACRIIMLTLHEEYVAEAIEAGAEGYLLKDIRRDELIRAIRVVEQGKVPLGPFSKDILTGFAASSKGAEELRLSERELSILQMIANGNNTQEIGTQLFLSATTVKRNVRRILDKLNVHNRSEAVAEAYRKKLI